MMFASMKNRWYPSGNGYLYWMLYMMPGTPPTTATELKNAVDMRDLSAIHSASVGCGVVAETVSYADKLTKSSFSPIDTHWALRNGSMLCRGNTSKYMYMPARYFRVDGRLMTYARHMPYHFSNPWNPTHGAWGGVNQTPRDSTDPLSVVVQLEYDIDVPVTGVRHFGSLVGSTSSPSSFKLYYYDESTSTWVQSGSTYTLASATTPQNFALPATATAKKFRIELIYASAAVGSNFSGICLYGDAALPAVAVPDITWGILTPIMVLGSGAGLSAIAPGTWNSQGSRFNYVPAVVDTAGGALDGKKMVITKATGLVSTDQPKLSSYIYTHGGLV